MYIARDYVADGVFTPGIEGPATGPDGLLYVVNFGSEGTIGRVYPQADGSGHAELFVTLPQGSVGNGIRFGHDGMMYVADHQGHGVLKVDPRNGEVTQHAQQSAMSQPNDIAITQDDVLYATDPNWTSNSGQLWRIDRDGSTHLLETGMGTTNGIEVSPDGKHLYVNESVQRSVWQYTLQANGSIGDKQLLIQFAEHGLDGMRCDDQGNLYIARHGAGVVAIVSPEGTLLREVALKGTKPSNVAFGGPDGRSVYVTLQDRGAIETFRAEHPGREYDH
ncbi:MAG: SMP-30/gluconolactonase/LRE family protein [Pseudoxanthomonas sp.]